MALTVTALRKKLPKRGYADLIVAKAERAGISISVDVVRNVFSGRGADKEKYDAVIKYANQIVKKGKKRRSATKKTS